MKRSVKGRSGTLALFVLLGMVGCHSRGAAITGTWEWGDDILRFEEDGRWEQTGRKTPGPEYAGGRWSIAGDRLTLEFDSIDPPNSEDTHFLLSPDGRRLVVDGEPHSGKEAIGSMTKR